MKPSNAKVIVLFDQYQWRGMPVDVAVPVGRRIPPRALNWLKKFAEVHGRPLLYAEQIVQDGSYVVKQRVAAYGPAEFQQEFTPAEIQQQPLSHDMPFGQQRRPATSIQTAQQPSFGE